MKQVIFKSKSALNYTSSQSFKRTKYLRSQRFFEFEHISDIVDDFLPTAGYFFATHGGSVVTAGTWNSDRQVVLLCRTLDCLTCMYIPFQPSPHIKNPNMTKHFGTEFLIWWVGTNPQPFPLGSCFRTNMARHIIWIQERLKGFK
jgi:hypothetical protein